MEIAKSRLEIIKPLIGIKTSRKEIEKFAKENKVGTATIYRWLKSYKESGLMSSLIPEEKKGGKGKSRLNNRIDDILNEVFRKYYLKDQRKKISNIETEVILRCKDLNIDAPHYSTIRRRIQELSEYEKVKNRHGKTAARKKFAPKLGKFTDDDFPLSSVQIDHTPIDIITVDEKYRQPLGRPWLTLAIDTYSRMVVGFYIGYEKPNAMSVGLCVSQSILPKEELLVKLGLYKSEWPCHGVMRTIHVDNAMEFRSKMLENSCLEYNIDINWRPVKTPEYGGIVERYLGTLSSDIHQLKGTTFNNFRNREEYDSEGNSVFTFSELQKWITLNIVDVYHQKFHKGIGMSPIAKWKVGIYGTENEVGTGYEPPIHDKRKLLLDFMPAEERTVQDYGVLLDGIYYYSEILRKWINKVDVKSGKLRAKKKFKFKVDPRDLSVIYFLDPEIKEYFKVPYRDTSNPPINRWELKAARKHLFDIGFKSIDENKIFETHKKLKEIEEAASKKTKFARKNLEIKNKQNEHKQVIDQEIMPKKFNEDRFDDNIFSGDEYFKDIDDEPFN